MVLRVPSGASLSSMAVPSASLAGCNNTSAPASLSVLTYNVLADVYVRVPGQPWNAFAHATEQELQHTNRLPKIQQQLLQCAADVICLQEIQFEEVGDDGGEQTWQLPSWTHVLKEAGYTGVMQGLSQKELNKNAERNQRCVGRPVPTGLATFYKATEWEEAAPSKHGNGSGIVLFLRSKANPSVKVAVGNVHLNGDPLKADMQLKQLDSCLKNLRSQGAEVPQIIAGDFNNECLPGSEVAQWLTSNGLQGLQLGGSTWAEPGKGMHLDHVAYSTGRMSVVAMTEPLSDQDVARGLPHEGMPSDHIPVGALFQLQTC